MNNVYKISYIQWQGDELHCGGQANVFSTAVVAKNHKFAVAILRDSVDALIEIVSITKLAEDVLD